MFLKWYRRPRLVVLKTKSSVLEAARAIENNNIGAVIVQDKGRVVGIITDRDLTVRVVGQGLDPRTTLLADVMTTPVVALSPADSQHDAIRLMQERNVRRIPLVEEGRLVGIITLDDLLLDEAAPLMTWPPLLRHRSVRGGRRPLSASGAPPAPRRPIGAC